MAGFANGVLSIFIVEQNLTGILAITLDMFYRCLGIHMMHHVEPLCTKPEVNNVKQCCQRKTEPGP